MLAKANELSRKKRNERNRIDYSIMYSRYSNEFKQNPRDKKKLGKKIPKENTKIGNLDFLKRKNR